MKPILKYWGPALLWIGVINLMSIDLFSARDTGQVTFWILAHLGVAREHWETIHFLVRKAGHVTEYGILSGMLFWSLRATTMPEVRRAWHPRWARVAWVVCTLVAIGDEIHQSFVPSRTAAVHDVVLDSAAALAVQIVLWLTLRHRPRTAPAARNLPRVEAPTSA